uniref:Prefoldin subunit 5 n=2 Tax=Ascaris TaxID=6251 RepID=F1LCD3_ASCSU
MNASGDKKAVPIGDLSIERLSALQKQVEHEITFFAESLNELKIFEAKFAASEQAVSSINSSMQGNKALIPLSESMYISAVVADPSKLLVEIGTGYFVEMNVEKAKDFFKRKQEYLKKQIATVEEILPEKRRARQAINENLQKKVQAVCAQIPLSSK